MFNLPYKHTSYSHLDSVTACSGMWQLSQDQIQLSCELGVPSGIGSGLGVPSGVGNELGVPSGVGSGLGVPSGVGSGLGGAQCR